MSYFLAIPDKREKYGTLLWKYGNFSVYGTKDRFSLFLKDYYLGELVNGYQTLNKKFDGNFQNWIEFLKNKDLVKIEKTKIRINELNLDCEFIDSLWKQAEFKKIPSVIFTKEYKPGDKFEFHNRYYMCIKDPSLNCAGNQMNDKCVFYCGNNCEYPVKKSISCVGRRFIEIG